jgi:pimeloyl-ACP methyl ester carboxylesterase
MRLIAIIAALLLVSGCRRDNSTHPAFHGQRIDFSVTNHKAFLIEPPHPSSCWVWYAPTLEYANLPGPETVWLFNHLLDSGVWVGGVDVGESYGNQDGRKVFDSFYAYAIKGRGLQKPILLAQSRGGLMHLNWAEDHPENVRAIAGIYPVADLASYPGLGSKELQVAYSESESQLRASLTSIDPINRIDRLASAHIPLFLIAGDSDKVVPASANSVRLSTLYKTDGGNAALTIVPGRGHETAPEFFQSPELLHFLLASCAKQNLR